MEFHGYRSEASVHSAGPGNLSPRGPQVSCIIFQGERRCRVWGFLRSCKRGAKGTPRGPPSFCSLLTPSAYNLSPSAVANEGICFRVRSDGRLSPRSPVKNIHGYLAHVSPVPASSSFIFPLFSIPAPRCLSRKRARCSFLYLAEHDSPMARESGTHENNA